jgi:dihydroorotase
VIVATKCCNFYWRANFSQIFAGIFSPKKKLKNIMNFCAEQSHNLFEIPDAEKYGKM